MQRTRVMVSFPIPDHFFHLSTLNPIHTFAPSLAPLSPGTLDMNHTSSAIFPPLCLEQGFTQGAQIGVFYAQ